MRPAFDFDALPELDVQYYLIMVTCSYHQINMPDSISNDRERPKNVLNPQPKPKYGKEKINHADG